MGYAIAIGRAEIYKEDGYSWITVPTTAHPDAPVFENDDMTSNTNTRHLSYSSWRDFEVAVGLEDLFDELIANHPDNVELTWDHYDEVVFAISVFEGRYPLLTPTFNRDDNSAHYARLLWLEWWMKYALENYDRPVFHNR
jgi:hypothetical protein